MHTLLSHPGSSILELAEKVGINAISVRHHLSSLQADGLVTADEERHGVGRPRMVYSLTERGMEKFPTRYLNFTNRLLDQIKGSLPEQTVKKIFDQMAQDLASDHANRAAKLPIEERLNYVKEVLSKEGFSVNWEKKGEQYEIFEIACPYFQVSQNHPEICAVDQKLISTVLSVPIEKIKCVLQGDKHCSYMIQLPKATENI